MPCNCTIAAVVLLAFASFAHTWDALGHEAVALHHNPLPVLVRKLHAPPLPDAPKNDSPLRRTRSDNSGMYTLKDQGRESFKVIVIAKITDLPQDKQTYFWSNGRWQTSEELATKMQLKEADELVAGFLSKPILPMSPASKYNFRKVHDRPLRKVG